MVKHASGSMEPISQFNISYSSMVIELGGVSLKAQVYRTPKYGFFVTFLDKAWEGLWLKSGKPKWSQHSNARRRWSQVCAALKVPAEHLQSKGVKGKERLQRELEE
eukprot:12816774-Prorocentrum_lima.AAC.1